MPSLATPRPRFLARLTSLLILGCASLAATDASAGWPHDYSQRWYGQDFYRLQSNGHRTPDGRLRQSSGGYWGPQLMYGREYGDLYYQEVERDQPFAPRYYRNRNGVSSYND